MAKGISFIITLVVLNSRHTNSDGVNDGRDIEDSEVWRDSLNHTCDTYGQIPDLCLVASSLNVNGVTATTECSACEECCVGESRKCPMFFSYSLCETNTGCEWICSPDSPGSSENWIYEEDRKVLETIFDTTNGMEWQTSWDLSMDLCNQETFGVVCDVNNRVIEVDLTSNNLHGTIPTEIGMLDQLLVLILKDNSLYGDVPSEIGELSNLRSLRLNYNFLTSLPTEIGRLQNLDNLKVSYNELAGTLVTEIGRLEKLSELEFASNSFEGTIPAEFGDLASLESLWLPRNKLTGSIPTQLGKLTQLETLMLSENMLDGELPTELGNLETLIDLYLQKNSISGSIPSTFGNLTNLKVLDISSNSLTGEILPQLVQMESLEQLLLLNNHIEGTLPPEFPPRVKEIVLYNNRLSGSIPSSLGYLIRGDHLDISQNLLTGSIPSTFGSLHNYQHLRLSSNRLNGSIPAEICGLRTLNTLTLSNNQLSGTIPGCTDWHLLENIHLESNMLTGSFAPSLDTLPSISILSLSHNLLSGELPSDIGISHHITEMKISDNQLSGSIPSDFWNLGPDLTTLDLSNNKLEQQIPKPCTGLNLRYLDLSSNVLSGSIPAEVFSWPLLYMSLRDNKLDCEIQTDIGNLGEIIELYLDSNEFFGTIPTEFGKLQHLKSLYLQENQLTGSIPTEIAEIGSLEHLLVGENTLHDSIPKEVYSLISLETLNLHGNNLDGSISSEIGNLVNLQVINLGENSLSGTIPPELGKLSLLTFLSVSQNALEGTIPESILSIPSVELLRLSGNRLRCPVVPYNNTKVNDYDHYFGPMQCYGGEADVLTDIISDMRAVEWDVEAPWLLSLIHYCSFTGITCQTKTGPITSIDLRDVTVSGTLPLSLPSLNLTSLYLGNNSKLHCPVENYSEWANETDYMEFFGDTLSRNCFFCDATPPNLTELVLSAGGTHHCSNFELFGSVCNMECRDKHAPVYGDLNRVCDDHNDHNDYADSAPKCVSHCYVKKLPFMEFGDCVDILAGGESCTMECQDGYMHDKSHGDLKRVCGQNGKLDDVPKCQKLANPLFAFYGALLLLLLATGALVADYFYFFKGYAVVLVVLAFANLDFYTSIAVLHTVHAEERFIAFDFHAAGTFLVLTVCYNAVVVGICLWKSKDLRSWAKMDVIFGGTLVAFGFVNALTLFLPSKSTFKVKYTKTFRIRLSYAGFVGIVLLSVPQFIFQFNIGSQEEVGFFGLIYYSLAASALNFVYSVMGWILVHVLDLIQRMDKGKNLCHHAKRGNLKKVKSLLASDADINATDRSGRNALIHAARAGQLEVVQELVTQDPEINFLDQKSKTALLHACEMGHAKIVEELLNWSAFIDVVNNDGDTPLHIAVRYKRVKVIKILHRFFPSYQIENKNGETPFDLACRSNEAPLKLMKSLSGYFCFSVAKFVDGRDVENVEPLESGHYGDIYTADIRVADTVDGPATVRVVCKISLESAGMNEWHELQVLQNLPHHPNVAGLLAMCTGFQIERLSSIKYSAMIMLFKKGGSLETACRRKKTIYSLDRLLLFGMDMARGVRHLHGHGYKHCDIAARNFLLSRNETKLPKDQRVAITDFGLSRPMELQHDKTTRFPMLWCPPEMLHGRCGEATDVYMLGCAFYELSNIRYIKPFGQLPPCKFKEHVERIKDGERLAFPKSTRKWLDDNWVHMIMWCTEVDPTKRPMAKDIVEDFAKMEKRRSQSGGVPPQVAESPKEPTIYGSYVLEGQYDYESLISATPPPISLEFDEDEPFGIEGMRKRTVTPIFNISDTFKAFKDTQMTPLQIREARRRDIYRGLGSWKYEPDLDSEDEVWGSSGLGTVDETKENLENSENIAQQMVKDEMSQESKTDTSVAGSAAMYPVDNDPSPHWQTSDLHATPDDMGTVFPVTPYPTVTSLAEQLEDTSDDDLTFQSPLVGD